VQDKLRTLFDKIDFPKEYETMFHGAILDKVILMKDRNCWVFCITLEETLPLDIYKDFVAKLQNSFEHIQEKRLLLEVKEEKVEYVEDYYRYFLECFTKEMPILKIFKDYELKLQEQTLIMEVFNQAELQKIEAVHERLTKCLNTVGYHISLQAMINEEKHAELKKEILEVSQEMKVPLPKEKKEEVKEEKPAYLRRESNQKDENTILGRIIKDASVSIKELTNEDNNVTVECQIFGIDLFESSKTNFKIITLKITDFTDSIYAKVFVKEDDEYDRLKKEFKVGTWLKIRGYTKNDPYAKDLVLNVRDANKIEKPKETRKDEALEKRVELHTHSFMSQMDGVVDINKLIKRAKEFGHKALAITDHNCAQSFPEAYRATKNDENFKMIYGVELNLIDDSLDIVFREDDSILMENTYVVFDFETTGFNAGGADSIIEVGAVKLHHGEIIERFDELINPGHPLAKKITDLTGITDEMLASCSKEEEVIKRFLDWTGNLPMVAHNAKFDASFLERAYKIYNLGEYKNPLIDTLELSRAMDPSWGRHGLSALVKRYDVPFDEESHHRGDYDAEATALIFHKMLEKLNNRNIERMNEINHLVPKDELHKIGDLYHCTLLVKDKTGLKNLFKIISYANTKYLYKTPRILRSEITKHRDGILVGSSCVNGEIFRLARSKSEDELINLMSFYDYIELQPLECYEHLLQMNDFASKAELIEHVRKILRVAESAGKLVVATGDVHQLDDSDKIYREIIVNQKVPGGGRHPLNRKEITSIPSMYFRTTEEMLRCFEFLGAEKAYEIVVTNTNKIADMIEKYEVIIATGGIPFSPKMDNSEQIVTDMVYDKAKSIYGDPLPKLIQNRLERELNGIIGGGFDVIYLIAQKLVKKSNDDGYLVGSRGSVGSSFVAAMMGITEVNALPAHYVCPNCKKSIFELDGRMLGMDYSSGYDLPNRTCECGAMMKKEGQDMPFETFLGFKADKVPDIDLNFSSEYQSRAHEYTKVLFGEHNVFRAGTIGTVAEKTAFGFVKGYLEEKGKFMRTPEIERLAIGCTGIKRTTGQHPGGIVVVPGYMDVFDFTPYQYPADDSSSAWCTTQFDYHSIEEDLLKLDILGHDDPTVLKMLQDLSGMDINDIPMDDMKVISLFSSPEALGVTKEQILCETGSLGLPETGTRFVINMLAETKPKTFAELVKISGLSHGTDVWNGNAQELIKNKICEFKDVIGCRDDIMTYLSNHGLDPSDAFKIMEFVRKGKPSKDKETWSKWSALMQEKGIVDWYIESCRRIKYMFPKAHATAYIMMCCRVAYFKVYHPIWYYCAYFSIRCADFDIDTMILGYDAIKKRMAEINNKGFDATNKETNIESVLEVALEMTARGFSFAPLDLARSDAKNFVIMEDQKTLIPPFRSIDGLGDTVANNIIEERSKQEFISIEDFAKRCKVSQTLVDKMRAMGLFQGLPESSQLTLF